MKKILLFIAISSLLITWNISAKYDENLDKNPIFMENVFNFINSVDSRNTINLTYCEQVYLEATRRREYTDNELLICWDYFIQKNNEEKAYMQYMFNNRELFY